MAELNSSSARIFASVVAGEPDAATQLFHRYLRRLCRLAQTRIGSRLAQRIDPEDVVRFLRKELQDSPAIVERFLSEAAVVQRLKHTGLVRVDGMDEQRPESGLL